MLKRQTSNRYFVVLSIDVTRTLIQYDYTSLTWPILFFCSTIQRKNRVQSSAILDEIKRHEENIVFASYDSLGHITCESISLLNKEKERTISNTHTRI